MKEMLNVMGGRALGQSATILQWTECTAITIATQGNHHETTYNRNVTQEVHDVEKRCKEQAIQW